MRPFKNFFLAPALIYSKTDLIIRLSISSTSGSAFCRRLNPKILNVFLWSIRSHQRLLVLRVPHQRLQVESLRLHHIAPCHLHVNAVLRQNVGIERGQGIRMLKGKKVKDFGPDETSIMLCAFFIFPSARDRLAACRAARASRSRHSTISSESAPSSTGLTMTPSVDIKIQLYLFLIQIMKKF